MVFFGEQFSALKSKERGHAIGVVANTLASLAVNQAQSVDADGMTVTLGTLSDRSNELIETLVQDESAGYLFPQNARICAVIRDAFSNR